MSFFGHRERALIISHELTPEPKPIAGIRPGLSIVDRDTPCRRCGYNVRGLSATARCPECGVAVDVSLNGDLLGCSDPQFVWRLWRGVRLLLCAIIVATVGAVAAGFMAAFRQSSALAFGIDLLPLAASVLNIVGAWWLTTPDPSGIGEDRYGTARKVIRYALIADVLNQAISLQSNVALPQAAHIGLQLVGELCALAGLIGLFAQLRYLEKLALRVPDHALSDRARRIKWGLCLTYALLLLIGAAAWVFRGPRSAWGMVIPLGIVLLGMLAYGIMYLLMLIEFGRAFAKSGRMAMANWDQTL